MNPVASAPCWIQAATSELPAELQQLADVVLDLNISRMVVRCGRGHAAVM